MPLLWASSNQYSSIRFSTNSKHILTLFSHLFGVLITHLSVIFDTRTRQRFPAFFRLTCKARDLRNEHTTFTPTLAQLHTHSERVAPPSSLASRTPLNRRHSKFESTRQDAGGAKWASDRKRWPAWWLRYAAAHGPQSAEEQEYATRIETWDMGCVLSSQQIPNMSHANSTCKDSARPAKCALFHTT